MKVPFRVGRDQFVKQGDLRDIILVHCPTCSWNFWVSTPNKCPKGHSAEELERKMLQAPRV